MKEQILAKALNSVVTKDKFVDKDINKYLYDSLSQPSIKIKIKHGSDNEHDRDVICPNCGSVINYGKQTRRNQTIE